MWGERPKEGKLLENPHHGPKTLNHFEEILA
jgi:hypothetical protein